MIGMRTILEVADNSGARKLQCILPRGGDLGLKAGLGDVITAAVKEATPDPSVVPATVVTESLAPLLEASVTPLPGTTLP